MNSRFLTLIVTTFLLLPAVNIEAAQVSEAAAQDIAVRFFSGRSVAGAQSISRLSMKAPKRKGFSNIGGTAYYIFNNAEIDGGWVIVSGDDRTQQILAYSDKGSFSPYTINESTQWLLDMYAEEIGSLDEAESEQQTSALGSQINLLAVTKSAIAPFVKSQWGQRAPFYLKCPQVNSKYCVTGCVATAMAQIMYYYKWPTTSKAIPSYTPKDMSEQAALPATSFAWSSMKDYYSDSETSTTTANTAVATLMRYCGQAMEMNYGTSSSGATTSPYAFVNYFGYNSKIKMIGRSEYTASTWQDVIYTELAAGRPVLFSGSKATGGHAFVCDGYDGKGLFHINWGWYGHNNGYYALDVLNSSGGGTGSIAGEDGYVCKLKAIIGIEPLKSGSSSSIGEVMTTYGTPLISGSLTGSASRSSSSSAFSATISGGFWNCSNFAKTFDFGWGFFNSSNQLISVIGSFSNIDFGAYSLYKDLEFNVSFGSNYSSGTYYLRPISKPSNTNESWTPIIGSGANYIKAVISSTSCSLTAYGSDRGSLVCKSVSVTGTKKVGHKLQAKVQLTNNSGCDYHAVYLRLGGKMIGANSAIINAGATGQTTINFIPTASGSQSLELFSDSECQYLLYSSTLTINESPEASLTATSTVTNYTNGYIEGTTAGLSVKVTNNGTTNYSDEIIAYIYKQFPDNYYYREYGKTHSCTIGGSGGTNTVNFSFDNLEVGAKYMFIINYYSAGEEVRAGKSYSFEVKNSSGTKGDVNNDGNINVGDIAEVYKIILGKDLTNKSRAYINDDDVINAGDISALYSIILGK